MDAMIFISFAKKTRQQGFTLIEVLVVAVLLAIITAIAIPLLRDNVREAYVPEAEAVLASISTTAQRCKLQTGAFNNAACNLDGTAPLYPSFTTQGYVDTHTTNKWTFAYKPTSATTFTATATGVETNSDLKGKTITITYNLAATPHETKAYNF